VKFSFFQIDKRSLFRYNFKLATAAPVQLRAVRRRICMYQGENCMANETKRPIVSAEGLKKLTEELDYYRNVRRAEIAEQIKTAKDFGDLSENAEYDEAKNEQSRVEHHILELEDTIRNAQVIDENDITTDRVSVGSVVKVLDLAENEEAEYAIVGGPEADPMRNRISNESPVGSALLGRTVGETVEISVPSGTWSVRVLDIHL